MPQPGIWIEGGYVRRITSGSRRGPTELHNRRLNPVGMHAYGRDLRKRGSPFGEFTTVQAHRRRGKFVSRHRRRR